MCRRRAALLEQLFHWSKEDQERRAAFSRSNLYVLPGNTAAPASLQSFQRCFFCRKARGIMLRRHRSATVAIGAFGGRENTFSKARCAPEHFANASNFDNVYANGNDH